MWTDIKCWRHEVHQYVNASSTQSILCESNFDKIAKPKNLHQMAFQHTLYEAITAISEEFFDTDIRYSDVATEMFYIIGFSMFDEPKSEKYHEFYLTDNDIKNGKCIFIFGDNILCLDLFEVNQDDDYIGHSDKYYKAMTYSLQQFEEAMQKHIVINNKRYEAYMRQCTHAEYILYRNSAIVFNEIPQIN